MSLQRTILSEAIRYALAWPPAPTVLPQLILPAYVQPLRYPYYVMPTLDELAEMAA